MLQFVRGLAYISLKMPGLKKKRVNTMQSEDHPLENTPTDRGPDDNPRTYTRVLVSIILLWPSLMLMNKFAKFHVSPHFDCNV